VNTEFFTAPRRGLIFNLKRIVFTTAPLYLPFIPNLLLYLSAPRLCLGNPFAAPTRFPPQSVPQPRAASTSDSNSCIIYLFTYFFVLRASKHLSFLPNLLNQLPFASTYSLSGLGNHSVHLSWHTLASSDSRKILAAIILAQQIPHILCILEVHYRSHKSSALVDIRERKFGISCVASVHSHIRAALAPFGLAPVQRRPRDDNDTRNLMRRYCTRPRYQHTEFSPY
jgi:hypothetical protein